MTRQRPSSDVLAGIGQIAQVLRAGQWTEGEKHGLTPTQIGVLGILCERGPMRITVLARHMGVTQPTISDTVAALEAKALVHRAADPHDGRATLVTATDQGRITDRDMAVAPALAQAVEALGEDDLARLKRALTLLVRNLQGSGAIVPQRHCLTCRFFRPYTHTDAAQPHHCDFVDAAFGDARLRLDCGDHETAPPEQSTQSLRWFVLGSGG